MEEMIDNYLMFLRQEEKSESTQKQYERAVLNFLSFVNGRELTKLVVIEYKQHLNEIYKVTSANAMIAAVNSFLKYIGRGEITVNSFKVQKQMFVSEDKMITKSEYLNLVKVAMGKGNKRLAVLLETLGSTGIRVSELKYITIEAVKAGRLVIQLKGKTREILMPHILCKKLIQYAKEIKIESGQIFVTRNGKPLDRSNIWKMLKAVSKAAKVLESKVFPHSFRHLFARMFYSANKDIAKLADVLGHSSINTTRIYITSTDSEHRKIIDSLGLCI